MNEHTPGPWDVRPKSIAAPNGVRYTVYELWNGPDICEGREQSREVEANERLIAAAPDLLAALEDVYDIMAEKGFGSPGLRAFIVQTIHAARGLGASS